MIPLERNFYGHPLAGLLWERHVEEALLKVGWEKYQVVRSSKTRVISVSICG